MANINQKTRITTMTFAIEPPASRSAATIILSYGLCETTRKGRSSRSMRNIFNAATSEPASIMSRMEDITMQKSSMFQESRK